MSSPDVRQVSASGGKVLLEIDHEGAALTHRNRYAIGGTSLAPCIGESMSMTLPRVFIAVLFFATVFAGSNLWIRTAAHRNVPVMAPARMTDTTSVLDDHTPTLHGVQNDWTEPRVDLNGNEIDAAVGDYRVDTRGELYERHAPDTALLHLGAPRL